MALAAHFGPRWTDTTKSSHHASHLKTKKIGDCRHISGMENNLTIWNHRTKPLSHKWSSQQLPGFKVLESP
jgi:hypothetical protein